MDIATKVATATQLEIPIELNGIKLTARPEMFKEKLQSDYEFAFARARAERLAIVRSSRRDGDISSTDDVGTPRTSTEITLSSIPGGRVNEVPPPKKAPVVPLALPPDSDEILQPDAFRSSADPSTESSAPVREQRAVTLSEQVAVLSEPSWNALTERQRAEVSELVDERN